MLVGLVAGLLTLTFLKMFGEPQGDRVIAFESQMNEAKAEAATDEARAEGRRPCGPRSGCSSAG